MFIELNGSTNGNCIENGICHSKVWLNIYYSLTLTICLQKKKDKALKKEPSTTAEIETQTEEPGSQADQEEMETAKMGVSDLDIVSRLDQKMLNQVYTFAE